MTFDWRPLTEERKTPFLGSCANLDAFNLETWPGVFSGQDEDPRPKRTVEQRVAIEVEKKNSKEAVENGNSHSFLFWWQQKEEITLLPPDAENRSEKETTKKLDLKDFKTGLEVQDDISVKEGINDETAEVKIEEAGQFVKTESKHINIPRRQAGKRVKGNARSIIVPDLSAVHHKQVEKTCKTVKDRKLRNIRKCAPKQPCLSFEEIIESILHIAPAPAKRRRPNSNLSEPRDSRVHSGESSNGTSDGCSSSSGSDSGSSGSDSSSSGGSSSGGCFGGKGNADRDEGNEKEYPQWYFLGKQKTDTAGRNERKRSLDEEKNCPRVKKMRENLTTVTTDQSGLQMFLSSIIDNAEQFCCFGEEGTHMTTIGKVKKEIEHVLFHEELQSCEHSSITQNVIAQHTHFCCSQGCSVFDCESFRGSCEDNREPLSTSVPVLAPQFNRKPPVAPVFVSPTPRIDGRVIFRNSTDLPEKFFLENKDFIKMKEKKLGIGSNAEVFVIYLTRDNRKKMAMKETKYHIEREEVEVYKMLGEHPHIITHYGVTLRENKGHANIFMELCEQSLFDYMDSKLKRRLTLLEAMFYAIQILVAVVYLHNLKVPIVHKDIKAKNVVLTADGSQAKLADFDSARRLPSEITKAGLKAQGTKGFASPEVLEEKPHGRAADIYSFGCFIIELMVGGPSKSSLHQQIKMLRELDPDLGQLVFDCTKENPKERPTACELLQLPVIQKYASSVHGGLRSPDLPLNNNDDLYT
ncbi:protein kinase 4-like isoform X2 [Stylophora pistillata]|uniref:protein kinase 4-like isoform X2 n=1 Tax=Stylophora pistillata TaxID=50429 RepID=UPI000C049B52|nr:protein kinase 4-like isoform X2 [Stylophora pistillata]